MTYYRIERYTPGWRHPDAAKSIGRIFEAVASTGNLIVAERVLRGALTDNPNSQIRIRTIAGQLPRIDPLRMSRYDRDFARRRDAIPSAQWERSRS